MALRPINTQTRITERSVKISDIDLKKNSISGDVIHGGTITDFASTGIKDTAGENVIEINNDTTNIYNDLFVRGKINCQTLQYNRAQVPSLDVTEAVRIDGNEVIWKNRLGKSVKESSLRKLGILDDLEVKETFYAKDGRVGINTTVPNKSFAVRSQGIEVVIGADDATGYVGTFEPRPFAIGTDDKKIIYIATDGKVNINNSMTVEGKLGIGINNPQEDLEVKGNIKFQDRIFSSGDGIPHTGTWTKGSIMWNNSPDLGQPVGWICLKGGAPGHWRSFGVVN